MRETPASLTYLAPATSRPVAGGCAQEVQLMPYDGCFDQVKWPSCSSSPVKPHARAAPHGAMQPLLASPGDQTWGRGFGIETVGAPVPGLVSLAAGARGGGCPHSTRDKSGIAGARCRFPRRRSGSGVTAKQLQFLGCCCWPAVQHATRLRGLSFKLTSQSFVVVVVASTGPFVSPSRECAVGALSTA